MGKAQEAIGEYERALRIKPDHVEAHVNLGSAFLRMGKVQEAIEQYRQALRINPDYAEAHSNLGASLQRMGELQEAVAEYEQALRSKPDYVEAHFNLGLALEKLGRTTEAISHYEQALRVKPDFTAAHYNLGDALLRAGKVQEAIGHYEQALRIKPHNPEALNNLAWLLATQAPAGSADPVRAVALAEQAGKLSGNRVAAYLDTLAAAYAAAGRFSDAIATAQRAVELARSGGQPQLAEKIESRLQLYRNGHAYSQSVGDDESKQPLTNPSNR
jgi:tetratricopeptide (TPR) repeat protein